MMLGKKPARAGSVSFKFEKYFDVAQLPTPPATFGNVTYVRDWGMLANDRLGDCVWAGAAHETMLWTAENIKRGGSDTPAVFNDDAVVSDYSALTGYDPGKKDSDQGTDVQEAADYRRKTGIVDATGKRHTIDAYVALDTSDLDKLASAVYLLGAVGVGIEFPSTAMQQFDMAEPWDVVAKAKIDGGHYIPCVGRNSHGNFLVVTWGRLQAVTPAFLIKYMDEAVAYLSLERLVNTTSPQGFDLATLQVDLSSLGS
jgi:hypothetical protein